MCPEQHLSTTIPKDTSRNSLTRSTPRYSSPLVAWFRAPGHSGNSPSHQRGLTHKKLHQSFGASKHVDVLNSFHAKDFSYPFSTLLPRPQPSNIGHQLVEPRHYMNKSYLHSILRCPGGSSNLIHFAASFCVTNKTNCIFATHTSSVQHLPSPSYWRKQ